MPVQVSAMARVTPYREAQRFEREIAEELGGRRIFLSGAGFEKNDVRKHTSYHRDENGVAIRGDALTFRVEAKTTTRGRYALRAFDWYALAREADAAGEMPLFAIRFLPHVGEVVLARQSFAHELGCLPSNDFILPARSSITIRPQNHVIIRLIRPRHLDRPHPPEVLVIGPYGPFMEALKAHALYAPSRPAQG